MNTLLEYKASQKDVQFAKDTVASLTCKLENLPSVYINVTTTITASCTLSTLVFGIGIINSQLIARELLGMRTGRLKAEIETIKEFKTLICELQEWEEYLCKLIQMSNELLSLLTNEEHLQLVLENAPKKPDAPKATTTK